MTADATSRAERQRSLLGLRGAPGRLALVVLRAPLQLYRRGWGWLLGRTFVLLVHVGRKTGTARETVAMVLRDEAARHEVVVCSAWGPDADWILNLRAGPAREVRIGRQSFRPEHRFLTDDEALAVIGEFRRRHPWRFRLISAVLGWGDLGADEALAGFAHGHPFVALRPARPNDGTSEWQDDNEREVHGR